MLRIVEKDHLSGQFRDVVQPHLADALALARRLTGSQQDAEDVVQEACIKALAGIRGYAGGSAKAWTLMIVRNTAFAWMKRHRSKSLVFVGDAASVDAASQTDSTAWLAGQTTETEAMLIRRAEASQVAAAIDALPLPFREVLVMRDINGLNYREIAEVMALPVGTVMSRLSRARAMLGAKLAEETQ